MLRRQGWRNSPNGYWERVSIDGWWWWTSIVRGEGFSICWDQNSHICWNGIKESGLVETGYLILFLSEKDKGFCFGMMSGVEMRLWKLLHLFAFAKNKNKKEQKNSWSSGLGLLGMVSEKEKITVLVCLGIFSIGNWWQRMSFSKDIWDYTLERKVQDHVKWQASKNGVSLWAYVIYLFSKSRWDLLGDWFAIAELVLESCIITVTACAGKDIDYWSSIPKGKLSLHLRSYGAIADHL